MKKFLLTISFLLLISNVSYSKPFDKKLDNIDIGVNYQQKYINSNGVWLHVVTAGPEDGEKLFLLHGFPEFWYAWRKQIPFLVKKGYRVIIPDQRGHNLSQKPKDVSKYSYDNLSKDLIELIDYFGEEKATILAHDLGGWVTWFTAFNKPDRIKKMILMNIPHPQVMVDNLKNNPVQKKKSWYMESFKDRDIPELLLGFNNFENLYKGVLIYSTNKNTLNKSEEINYKKSWSNKGTLTAMINWYRNDLPEISQNKVRIPTKIIWGKKDKSLGFELFNESMGYIDNPKSSVINGAGHYLMLDKPEEVNEEIYQFLKD